MTSSPSHRTVRITVLAVALVAALGGGAYAGAQLAPNSVGATQIKKNAVRTGDVKNGSLTARDLRPGQAAKALAGTRLGGDLTGTFPNPQVTGVLRGTSTTRRLDLPRESGRTSLFRIPGFGETTIECTSGSGIELLIRNNTTTAHPFVIHRSSEEPPITGVTGVRFAPNALSAMVVNPVSAQDNGHVIEIQTISTPRLTLRIDAMTRPGGVSGGCLFSATLTTGADE